MIDNEREEEIIAESFIKIRESILSGDWSKVCSAYEDITGEKIEPPVAKEKTKLERIREKIDEKSKKNKGATTKKSEKKIEKVVEEGEEIQIIKAKGGERFATDGFQVISSVEDEEEIQQNKKVARKRNIVPRTKVLSGAEGAFGYSENPKHAPPWR